MREQEPLLIRRPLLTGHQSIDGVWLPAERFTLQERARLILEHWRAGAVAYRFADGDGVQFSTPVALDCQTLAGWPLVRQGRGLCSAQLTAEELRALPAADLWLVRGSQVHALQLRDAEVLEPGLWLEISAYTLLDTFDCHAPIVPVLPAPDITDVREILGGLAPVSPEQEGVIRALLERQQPAPKAASPKAARQWASEEPAQYPALKLGATLALVAGLIWMATQGQSKPLTPVPAATTEDISGVILGMLLSAIVFTAVLMGINKFLRRGVQAVSAVPSAPADPGIAERAKPARHKPSAWRRWLTRLTEHSKLSRLYGKRQAAYMQRMLEMFEDGDFAEALRHAIPLGGQESNAEQNFGTPQRRHDLTLSQQSGSGRAYHFEQSLTEHLREVYRRSYERLARENRIEEAVFVLAELLKERQEALDYLEKHARYQQAADLALAWDMPSAVIVRLLCLAENWQRALLVARRDDAFADAVVLLQAKQPQIAERLRLEWAESLIAKGLWLQAVEVVWSLPDERPRAAQWLLDAEASGGRLAMGALVKRAILLPQTLEAYGPWIEQLRDDPDRYAERDALAQALLAHKSDAAALRWLAGATVHAVLADQLSGRGGLNFNQLQSLVKMSRDKCLQADLPGQALKRPARRSLVRVDDALEWTAPTQGSRPVYDAVSLDDERYLVALGEAGAVVTDASGHTLYHFAVPAQRIVLAHSRQMALVLTRRDRVWRISKLDLVNRTATDLGVQVLDVFAEQFDGSTWTLGQGRQLRVVDVDRNFETLWHVSDLPGTLRALKGDERNEFLWLYNPRDGVERWHYRLPERRLAGREPASTQSEENHALYCALDQTIEYAIRCRDDEEPTLILDVAGNRKGYRLPGCDEGFFDGDPVRIALDADWLVFGYIAGERDTRWHFIHRASDHLCAVLHWPRYEVNIRRSGEGWLLFDDQGRLSHITVDGARLRNLSLH
nr:bpX6 domain-containing protein [uncultured Pseudomonas sp.]